MSAVDCLPVHLICMMKCVCVCIGHWPMVYRCWIHSSDLSCVIHHVQLPTSSWGCL